MKLPLQLKLKKKAHQSIAYAQDLIMEELYHFFPKAVFHGGTAIWRCYQGNRFSEDIDVYLTSKEAVPSFFEKMEQKGFVILKKRVKENSLYSLMEFNRVQVRFEAIFTGKKQAVLKEYETCDGNIIMVYTLSPVALLDEKIAACLKRKKVRDIYDIFFLLRYAAARPKDMDKIEKIAIIDEENLPTIILSGLVPTVNEMKRYIAEWEP
jgi:predicted nucleotidyltransferase component of viral defense system